METLLLLMLEVLLGAIAAWLLTGAPRPSDLLRKKAELEKRGLEKKAKGPKRRKLRGQKKKENWGFLETFESLVCRRVR